MAAAAVIAALNNAALKHGLEPAFVRAVAWVESRFDPNAVSNKGAMGLLQLMPETAKSLGVINAFDPTQNAAGGAKYLAKLLKKYGGDERRALEAYNWGPGNVDSDKTTPTSVLGYADKVLARLLLEREVELEQQQRARGGAPPPLPLAAVAKSSSSSLECPSCGCLLELAARKAGEG